MNVINQLITITTEPQTACGSVCQSMACDLPNFSLLAFVAVVFVVFFFYQNLFKHFIWAFAEK